jgi:competence protein ComEA
LKLTCLLLPILLCFAASAQDGGKALLERTCTPCHKLDSTLSQRNSRARWAAIVDGMVAKGAEATDQEIERIVDYLAKNLPSRVNVNKATAVEIAGTLEIATPAATAIVDYRERNGAFKTLDDLRKVPALDWKALEKKTDRIAFD